MNGLYSIASFVMIRMIIIVGFIAASTLEFPHHHLTHVYFWTTFKLCTKAKKVKLLEIKLYSVIRARFTI